MNYEKLANTAIRLITKTGRSVVMQKLSAEAANSEQPWKGAGTPTVVETEDVIATFVPAGSGGLGLEFVDEELLKRAEQVALIAPVKDGLNEFHVVLDSAVRWKIEWAQVLKPADKILLYVVGVKR